jgi:hypothetical protein
MVHVRRSLLSVGLLAGLGAILPVGMPPAPAQAAVVRAAQGVPSGLSASGKALWGLESLLRRLYGSAPVWAEAQDPRGIDFDCAGQMCGPLASYDPYFYTFDNPTGTAFHIASSRYTNFGNYPVAVLVHTATTSRATPTLLVLGEPRRCRHLKPRMRRPAIV